MAYGFVEIVRGRVPLSTLGGPIMIGYVAGVAAEQGFDQYLWLMAVISINLALLNFLPVPILDGGSAGVLHDRAVQAAAAVGARAARSRRTSAWSSSRR